MLSETIHERMKGWFARILLGLIIISFALFGIDTYFHGTGGQQWVAEVNGEKIPALEFEDRLKREQARLREMGVRDPAQLESVKLRQQVLDEIIRERVLFQAALARGYDLPPEAVLARLAQEPAFQENGQFSEQRLQAFLAQRGLSQAQLVQMLRQDALVNHVMSVAVASTIVPQEPSGRLARALAETREVSRAFLAAEAVLPEVKVSEAEIEAYYRAHPELFRVPEQARVAYVVFSPEALLPSIELSEAALEEYYQRHGAEFAEPERRRLSHILLRLRPDAPPAEVAAARKKAEAILQEVRAAPGRFAELAKQYSADSSSAERGGDLGWLTPGALFPEVEREAFALKNGAIGGPVRSPAGLHIVMVTGVEPARSRPFQEVRQQVAEAARREAAMRRFSEEAEKFSDLVYAQFQSLEPAAKQYNLKIQVTGWLARVGQSPPPFDNERLRAAVFADEAVRHQRNTEAIEVAPNTLVAARVLEYRPAGQRSLDEVRGEIEGILKRELARKRVHERGQAVLERLRKGESVTGLSFDAPRLLDRRAAEGFDADAMRVVFGARAEPLPAYAGQATQDGFAIYRISRVMVDDDRLRQMQGIAPALLQRAQTSLIAQAYADSVRNQAKVEIRKAVLEKSER